MMEKLGISAHSPGRERARSERAERGQLRRGEGQSLPGAAGCAAAGNGKPVKNAKHWWKKRRPEIVELFDREVYGRMPKHVPGVTWSVKESREDVVGGKPVLFRKLVGHVDNSAYPLVNVDIEVELTTPKDAKGVPVIVEFFPFEFRGRFPAPPPPTWQEQVIARGWAYAILSTSTSRPTTARASRRASSASSTRDSRASPMTGARCAPGPGARRGCSTTSRPIPRSTRNAPSSKACRASARRRW